jgi:hypothetical protein
MNHNRILGSFRALISDLPPRAECVRTYPILTFTVEDPDYLPEDNE